MDKKKYHQVFTLKDGRKLGYAEFGKTDGQPVFYCHGWLGGRLDFYITELYKKKLRCHIYALDRPGIGLSTFKEKREILDFPDDVVEIADHLGLDKFHILGMSGGGPYVAACAYRIPNRLLSAGIIGGAGPHKDTIKSMKNPNRILFSLLRRVPFLFKIILYPMWNRFLKMEFNEKTGKMLARQGMNLPEQDKIIYENPVFQKFLIDYLKDILQQKTKKGAFMDGKLFTKEWNFKLKDIPKNLKFYIWHGEQDKNVSVEIGRYYEANLPNCEAYYYPDEAHLSVMVNRIEEILEKLTEL